ncbi:hypothetical protein AVEN_248507-1 [Araneus ventricosus]|uniref:Uncharacterized protein n=1 Tax=Araneus ventricosus TaxID=182803 RepID=A0A4Y2E031_ARAVE|nr:hypothetical protein AVEN_248507-1 [Araneus ventricosus]
MPKRCRWAARQSCPVVRSKAATASRLGSPLGHYPKDHNRQAPIQERFVFPLGLEFSEVLGSGKSQVSMRVQTS